MYLRFCVTCEKQFMWDSITAAVSYADAHLYLMPDLNIIKCFIIFHLQDQIDLKDFSPNLLSTQISAPKTTSTFRPCWLQFCPLPNMRIPLIWLPILLATIPLSTLVFLKRSAPKSKEVLKISCGVANKLWESRDGRFSDKKHTCPLIIRLVLDDFLMVALEDLDIFMQMKDFFELL